MIVLLGWSASGKTHLLNILKNEYGYKTITSWTTRKMRPGEVGGVDYNFVTDEEFKTLKNNGFFAETTSYTIYDGSTVYYGSAIEDLTEDKVIILNPDGFRQLKNVKSLDIVSFYITASEETLIKRLNSRGDNPDEYKRRLSADRSDFNGVENEVDFVIRNDGRYEASKIAELIDSCYRKVVDNE